jgi:hypothetical protein
VSLILEALKKLDREKKTPDRGFLVVGAVPWPARRERGWLPAATALALVAVAGSGIWLALRGRGEAPLRGGANVAPVTRPLPANPQPAATSAPLAGNAPAPSALSQRPEAGLVERRPSETAAAPPRPAALKPAAEADPASGLQLQAISERDGKPVAVLSNRLVREGDRFDGITVVRIGAEEVEIEVQGRRRTLRF